MSKYKKDFPVSSSFSSTFRICSQKNNDDSRYLIMVDTMSNIISIKVNNDRAKEVSIVKKTYYNLSFKISDFKQLLKEQFGITNDEAVFYCSFYDSEKTNNSDCGMRLFSLTELRNYCRLHSNEIFISLNNITVDFVFLLTEAEPNNTILKDITFSYCYNNKKQIFSIENSAKNYQKERGLYEFEVYIPLSITSKNIDYFDLVYYIQYNNSELFPNEDKRSKRIFCHRKYFNKVKYFIINSHVTIQDTLLNKLTSQIYSIENINYITVKEFGKYNFEYIIFDAEDEEEEKKLKTLFLKELIPEINTLILDLSTKEKFNEMIEFLVKDSYNTILIYKYNALEEKYRDFDITEYDYLSKALYKE